MIKNVLYAVMGIIVTLLAIIQIADPAAWVLGLGASLVLGVMGVGFTNVINQKFRGIHFEKFDWKSVICAVGGSVIAIIVGLFV